MSAGSRVSGAPKLLGSCVQEAQLTQDELADRAGITSSRRFGAIERAKVSISVTVLGQIAKALAVDPCDLVRSS